MRWKSMTILVALTGLLGTGCTTWGEYSMMFGRTAGQVWSGNQAGTQWAWRPVSDRESHISWGDPAAWPSSYRERFTRDDQWVYLDGWWDGDIYYDMNVIRETAGCAGQTTLPRDAAGRQHYAKWLVPAETYCLHAWGQIIHTDTGQVVNFRHEQEWANVGTCSNQYYSGKSCIRQFERWWDDNGNPGGPLVERQNRHVWLAKGLGMAFIIDDHLHNWHAAGRYYWTW